ncbi:hypothetical protein CVT25_007133 [Psilocybe cyanescens]|uniref:F-box domain-containing protein n=1 Tax=Psilocybe cyanescens TaxID=93625 RepID=A0A409WVG8_PSICY|nr:hypothetical protein CVT25_007133 [Psilocybe cyanescens]
MAAQVQLPPEILESVVDQLHDDPPSLMQCSLVCRRFANRGQKHLFRRVVLDRPSRIFKGNMISQFYPAESFLYLINHYPHICKLVLELKISDEHKISYYREQNSWIRTDRAIAKILPMLCALEELIIDGNHLGTRLNFKCWKEELKSTILLKSQSLRRLSLSLVRNVPLLLLNDMPNLECLRLNSVYFTPDDLPAMHFPNKARLRTFDIASYVGDDWPSLYPWLQSTKCNIDMTHLVAVSLMINPADMAPSDQLHSISSLLRGCANNLKHLHLCYSDPIATPSFYDDKFMDLGSMPLLESLDISGCVWSHWDHHGQSRDRLRWLTNNLAKIDPNITLKRIDLEIEVFQGNPQSGFEDAGWDDFAQVIDNLAQTVSAVFVKFVIYSDFGRYTQDFLQQRMLPLCIRGIVLIEDGIAIEQ